MRSSRLFSLISWPSKRCFKKEKVRSGNGKRARLKKRSRCWEEEEAVAKMVNMSLYLRNKCIMEENKRLREQALFLGQENQELQSRIQSIKKSSICALQS